MKLHFDAFDDDGAGASPPLAALCHSAEALLGGDPRPDELGAMASALLPALHRVGDPPRGCVAARAQAALAGVFSMRHPRALETQCAVARAARVFTETDWSAEPGDWLRSGASLLVGAAWLSQHCLAEVIPTLDRCATANGPADGAARVSWCIRSAEWHLDWRGDTDAAARLLTAADRIARSGTPPGEVTGARLARALAKVQLALGEPAQARVVLESACAGTACAEDDRMRSLLSLAEGRRRSGLATAERLAGQPDSPAAALSRSSWARNVAALAARTGDSAAARAWALHALAAAHGGEVPHCHVFEGSLETMLALAGAESALAAI